jgi:hypothetical protein
VHYPDVMRAGATQIPWPRYRRKCDLLEGVSVAIRKRHSDLIARNQPCDVFQDASRWNGPPSDRLCGEQVAQRRLLPRLQQKFRHGVQQ